jgi:hypothetical protein
MKGLLSTAKNTLTEYKATISIKHKDVLRDSKDTADCQSISSGTPVQPEITTNSNAQEEADRQNTYQLAVIGVKEGVAAGITKIIGKDITNPILCTSDSISFKPVDKYQLHQLVTAITEGAERPEATTIIQQFFNIARMVFNWRDTVAINVKKITTNAAKTQAYGIHVHDNLKAVVILANVEWATRQSWGTVISVAHHTIKAKYRYDHTHNTAFIKETLKVLTGADEQEINAKQRHREKRRIWKPRDWRAYASWYNNSRVSPRTVPTWRAHMQQPTARTGARAGAGAKAATRWTKRQRASHHHPRPPLVPPLHHL